jgi:GNAT superfamily N-acetyltransferase
MAITTKIITAKKGLSANFDIVSNADRDEIGERLQAIFDENLAPLLPVNFPKESKDIKGMMNLEQSSFILAMDGAKIIGYMLVQYPGGIEYEDGSVSANIRSVAVDADVQGQGVFKTMLETAHDLIKEERPECIRMTAQTFLKPKPNGNSVRAFTKSGYRVDQFESPSGERESFLQFTLPIDRFDDEAFKQESKEHGKRLIEANFSDKSLADLNGFTPERENYPNPKLIVSDSPLLVMRLRV